LVFCFVFLSVPCVFAEIHATQTFSGVYYHVDGDKSRSFYPGNEADHLYEGSVEFSRDAIKDYKLSGNLEYQVTDDRLVDAEGASIERMYLGLQGNGKEYRLGDFYANFSDYSLSNALKGGQFILGDDKSARLTVVGGEDVGKWEDLWESRCENSPGIRHVWGARFEDKFLEEKLFLSVNYGGVNDDKARLSSSALPVYVNVFSLESKYVFTDYLTAYTELAQSFTDSNTRDNQAKIRGDKAVKCGMDLNFQDYTLSSVYSRVGNYFNTTGGFSSQDLQSLSFDGVWYLPWSMKLQHYLRSDSDNLSKNMAATTRQLNPGGKLVLSLPKDISWDFGADMRKRFSTDKTTNEKTWTYTSNISRDFQILYATFGYTKTVVINRVSFSQERASDMYSFGFDGSFPVKGVKFNWNIGQDLTRDHYRETAKADLLTATNFGLIVKFPSTLRISGKLTLGKNNYSYNPSDSYTNNCQVSISRDLIKDFLFDCSYERKAYRYYGNSSNYTENLVRGKLSYKF